MAATVAIPVATVVFVLVGPLQSGWAKRAGTPTALLAPATAPVVTANHGASAAGWSSFTGRVTVTPAGSGHEVITVHASTSGRDARNLTIVLRGAPDNGGISMSSGSITIAPVGGGQAWSGPVTGLDGTQVAASLRGSGGVFELARLTLVIKGGDATGQVLMHPAVSQ
jgi:hypothetical protein